MLQYKLIVSDFDGTLRRSEGGISEGNIRAVGDYVAAGGIFALCTGRMMSSILPYAQKLHLSGLVTAYQGAMIRNIESGEIVRDCRIACSDAVEICEFLQGMGRHIHVYDGDDFYVNRDDDFRAWYEKACAVRGILTPENIAETVREKQISPHKIIVVSPPEEREKVLAAVEEKFGSRFYVTTSMEYLVEIVCKGCDKGGALEYLCGYYRIPVEQSVAIGDNYNDLPMVRMAGLGFAVANGEEALRREADFITRSCDEDGVGYVIRKFGLGENI